MRQQLRLRVLLPVALLGLLGAGFGAYATGRPADPDPGPQPPPTTTSEAEPAPGPVAPKAWAKQADALCVDTYRKMEALGELDTLAKIDAAFPQALEIARGFDSQLASLGWPRGEKAAVQAVRRDSKRTTAMLGRMRKALRTGDGAAFQRLVKRGEKLDAKWQAEMGRLGARKCAQVGVDAAEADSGSEGDRQSSKPPKSAAERLRLVLLAERAVVVVFYTPRAGVDSATLREARAAALTTDAGFLAVNVRRNREVEKLAAKHDVDQAPAVLVFKRGPKVATRFDGYADRETVAQAVANALR